MAKTHALPAFIAHMAAFDSLVAELQAMSADHFGADPETLNWGHVGELADRVAKLQVVADAYHRRGEFSVAA